MRLAIAAVLCLCVAQTAMAVETKVFEWRDADGVVSYSNLSPPPGTKGVVSREIDSTTLSPSQRVAVKAQLARIDAAEQAAADRYSKQIDAADLTIDAALRRLVSAESALRTGRVPLSDERIGTAGGHSRLRGDYFDRQKQLDSDVRDAQAAVDQAYRLRGSIEP
jgi:hypothetical protein